MAKREFLWIETKSFTGWRCGACGWVRLIPRLGTSAEAEENDAKATFDAHVCKTHPRERKPSEDFTQSAARIVGEATEKQRPN
jgi:hypothetical protein